MTLLYNIGIRIYYLLILIVSLFNDKAKFWIRGRRNCLSTIKEKIDPNSEYAWFHVSSLGEFEQGRPIIEALKGRYPQIKIIITFFSPSGYEIRKNYSEADIISYLPLDTKRNARKFLKLVNPKWTFFVKYEFWHHFLKQTRKSNSKLYLVSGIFRENQLFFKPYGAWYRKMLTWFDHFFVQNEESADLLKSLGLLNTTTTGDSRFDRVAKIASESNEIGIISEFSKNSPVIVCGSTWGGDEDLLLEYLHTTELDVKMILAPHEIKEEKIKILTDKINTSYLLYSQANTQNISDARVLIIDNIGMLSAIYKYGQISYIGGGFGAGIHNTLEAAVYGRPVIFGPNYRKFQEAKSLIQCKGGNSISSQEELSVVLNNYLSDNKELNLAGKAAGNYVSSKTGATKLILNYLESAL